VTDGMSAKSLVRELSKSVHDQRVLAAIADVPRDVFVPEDLKDRAWENGPLPIGQGQTISQPLVVARMCELLELTGEETVLDIGTGSGYHAAILARLARTVISIERHRSLSAQAARNLDAAGVDNVMLIVGDGNHGYEPHAPYEAINVAAASPGGVPVALEDQLAPGGRLVLPIEGTRGEDQRLLLVRNLGGELRREKLEKVRFVPLV
jgi:protein-L-isoaspartate(D-aspartate) O-methyltransferase